MFQEVVMGPDLIRFIHQKNYKSYLDFDELNPLKHDTLCLDDDDVLINMMFETIFQADNDLILDWWVNVFSHLNTKKYTLKIVDTVKGLNPEDIIEAGIVEQSLDKYWVKLKFSLDNRGEILKKITRYHPLTFEKYLSPEHWHGFARIGYKKIYKAGDGFPLFKLLEPWLRDADHVKISDPYLVSNRHNRAEKTLIKVIENCCKEGSKISIITIADSIREKRHEGDTVSINNLISVVKNTLPLYNIEFDIKEHAQYVSLRYIQTNAVDIDMGKGLDSYQGGKATRQTSIAFNEPSNK